MGTCLYREGPNMALRQAGIEATDPDLEDVTRYVCIICDVVIAIDVDDHEGELESVCNYCISESDENHALYVLLRGLDG